MLCSGELTKSWKIWILTIINLLFSRLHLCDLTILQIQWFYRTARLTYCVIVNMLDDQPICCGCSWCSISSRNYCLFYCCCCCLCCYCCCLLCYIVKIFCYRWFISRLRVTLSLNLKSIKKKNIPELLRASFFTDFVVIVVVVQFKLAVYNKGQS